MATQTKSEQNEPEEQSKAEKTIRPTKKQFETLEFIAEYIQKNGYSPSYREIMKGVGYTSVATVALHVNNLISRGHLIKRDRSARSIEVTNKPVDTEVTVDKVSESEEKWLVKKVERFFKAAETGSPSEGQVDELYVLIGALKILGLEGAAYAYIRRLGELKKEKENNSYAV